MDEEPNEERQWQLDARAFLWAVATHWTSATLSFLGGAASTYFAVEGHVIATWVASTATLLCLLIGFFRAWRDERRGKEQALRELKKVSDSYSHALTLGEVNSSYFDGNKTWEFWFELKNAIARPLAYTVDRVEVDGNITPNFRPYSSVIAANDRARYLVTRREVQAGMPVTLTCTVKIEISYGVPNSKATRKLTLVRSVDAFVENTRADWMDRGTTDVELSP